MPETMQSSSAWEWDLVGAFWWAAAKQSALAERIADAIDPEAFEDVRCRVVYLELGIAMMEDRPVLEDEAFVQRVCRTFHKMFPGQIGFSEAHDFVSALATEARVSGPHRKLDVLAARLWYSWRARLAMDALAAGLDEVAEVKLDDPRAALARVDEVLGRVEIITSDKTLAEEPQSAREIVAAERDMVENPTRAAQRITWPYPVVQRALGYVLPGRMYGITGYAGGGKSTFLANLFGRFCRRNVPCILIATESGQDLLRRAWAADAEVPQAVAENQLWDTRDAELMRDLAYEWGTSADEVESLMNAYRLQYLDTLETFADLPFELVDGRLTPEQVIRRLRIIRRRWPGQFVLAGIDHMHDLAYPRDEADKHVGPASQKIRAFCREDGLMSVVALYQPKKPEGHAREEAEFRPIPLQSFRGQVAQVLDGALSLYQARVFKDPHGGRTRWGSPRTARDPQSGFPWRCSKQQAEETDDSGQPRGFVDDQHIYAKPVKQRVRQGMKAARTLVLGFNADSGNVHDFTPTPRSQR